MMLETWKIVRVKVEKELVSKKGLKDVKEMFYLLNVLFRALSDRATLLF